ncbi:glycerophosphodiester phosphodiesterase family protein [Yeosuana marina]|uniref:glycerophosphodiester phosphodiesterase family protein n=1 Tax=Yeosuana marina TaxID=1565536 RepID=UPI0030ED14ED|tara:strand:- start:273 stop:992 length:720 start_codon:yes stop_codon:yes gene_type:complete
MSNNNNKVVAHRGAWKQNNLPENSIASLKHAIELQCAGSEFDVRMTSDSILVINHDPHYNGLLIEDSKYEDLIKFKLSNGEKLPTLKEYLIAGITNNTTTGLVCEIKPSKDEDRGKFIAKKVVGLVKDLKATPFIAFYISFDYDILKEITKISQTKTQYLNGNKSPDEVKADGISGIDYYLKVYRDRPEWIKRSKEIGVLLNAWTANTPEDLDWLLENNFDFITTNEPELLIKMIYKKI